MLTVGVFAGEELDAAQDQTAQRGAWAQCQQDKVSGFIHVSFCLQCTCVSVCFVCAGEGIKVLALLKTCQKSVNCVWFVSLCGLSYPLRISFACSI